MCSQKFSFPFFFFVFLTKLFSQEPQNNYRVSNGLLLPFGLQGKNITALATQAFDQQPTTTKLELFAATGQEGVFIILPFEASPVWQTLGLEKKPISAMCVQEWGVGPMGGLKLFAAVLSSQPIIDTTLIYSREVRWTPDTTWIAADSGIDKTKLKSVNALNSIYYTGHIPPGPRFAGGELGLYQSYGVYGVWSDVSPKDYIKINSIDVVPHWMWQPGSHVWAAGSQGLSPAVFHSNDQGKTWTTYLLPSMIEAEVFSIAMNPRSLDSIYVGMLNSVWISSDTGKTWNSMSLGISRVKFTAIAVDPFATQNIFIGGTNETNAFFFYHSSDGGKRWDQVIPPVNTPINGVSSIVVMNDASKKGETSVFIGTLGTGVWKYQPYISTDIHDLNDAKGFFLSQNYPNPFAQSTAIGYWLQASGFVRLEVFDLLGRKVATLVDEEKDAGEYTSTFDILRGTLRGNSSAGGGFDIRPGIYLYRLTSNQSTITKIMHVIK